MQSEPEPANTTSQSSPGWHWFAWTFAILLIAYPLSIGPVLRLESTGVIGDSGEKRLQHFYSPLYQLYKHSDSARHFFNWYTKLWAPGPAVVPVN